MKTGRGLAAFLLALALLCAGCDAGGERIEDRAVTLFAMDTVMELKTHGGDGDGAMAAAQDLIWELEGLLSVTVPDSEIYAVNHGETVALSPHTAALLKTALALCESTGGALDLTVYPVVRAWGFTTGACQVPDEETLSALVDKVDWRQVSLENDSLTLPAGVELDLGAAAKGYTGDRIMDVFRSHGVNSGIITLGGNVQALGHKPDGSLWRVAVRDPAGTGYAAVVEVADRAVVTSGGYERFFEQDGVRYWHILDPATGYPARSGLESVTIVSPSGVEADCLSTALFVMGREGAIRYWRERSGGFDFVLLGEDGTVTITPGLADHFTLADGWAEHPLEVVDP